MNSRFVSLCVLLFLDLYDSWLTPDIAVSAQVNDYRACVQREIIFANIT